METRLKGSKRQSLPPTPTVLLRTTPTWTMNFCKHCCGNIWELLCFLECFPVCPPWETLLRKHLRIAVFPRMFSSLSTLGNIVVETFENCYVSSNVFQFVHPGKHCCENIWELLCFLECFPVCPPWETLLRKHLRIAVFPRMFPSLSTLGTLLRKHLRIAVFLRMFPSLSTLGTLLRKHLRIAVFPRMFPTAVCPPWETLLRKHLRIAMFPRMFPSLSTLGNIVRKHLRIAMFPRMFPSLSTLGNIVAETFENCYVSSNVSQFVHPGKHCCGNIWELLCFLECFPVCPPWETLLRKHLRIAMFPRMFPSLSILGNIVAETFENCYVSSNVSQFVHPGKHCCGNIWELLCFLECFPVCPSWETLLRKHLRIAMFLRMFPTAVCPPWETLLRKHLRIAVFPWMFPSLSTLGNIVAETFENCYVSSNVSQFVHPGKHCCGNIWELLCFFECFPLQFVHPGKHCCGNIWELLCFLECFPVCPSWETLLRKHLRIAVFPRMFSSLSTLGNIVAETFENCCVSSNVSQFVHPGKHCCGNIWELLCFFECFPVCPPWETLLKETFENCCVSSNVSQFVHPGKHCCGNIWELLCFFECFPVCPPWETLLRKHLRIAVFPRMFPSLSILGNIVAETFENFYVSSNVSQFVHPGKHCCGNIWELLCFFECFPLQFVHPGEHCCGNIWELLCFLECFPVCPPWETLLNKLYSEDDYR